MVRHLAIARSGTRCHRPDQRHRPEGAVEVSVRVLRASELPYPTATRRPAFKATLTQSSTKSSAIATPVSIESCSRTRVHRPGRLSAPACTIRSRNNAAYHVRRFTRLKGRHRCQLHTGGLHHLSIRTTDLSRAKRFYTETLGFQQVREQRTGPYCSTPTAPFLDYWAPLPETSPKDRFDPLSGWPRPHRPGVDTTPSRCTSSNRTRRCRCAQQRSRGRHPYGRQVHRLLRPGRHCLGVVRHASYTLTRPREQKTPDGPSIKEKRHPCQ